MNIDLNKTKHLVLGDDLTFGISNNVRFNYDLFIQLSKDYGFINYSYTLDSHGNINEFSPFGINRAFFLGSL
jgi:hypothetical protein